MRQDTAKEGDGPLVPAHEGGDDDTPGSAAAVSIEVLLALAVAAAQPERVEQEEEQVQGQAGESDATQQQQGLQEQRRCHTWPGLCKAYLENQPFCVFGAFLKYKEVIFLPPLHPTQQNHILYLSSK